MRVTTCLLSISCYCVCVFPASPRVALSTFVPVSLRPAWLIVVNGAGLIPTADLAVVAVRSQVAQTMDTVGCAFIGNLYHTCHGVLDLSVRLYAANPQ